MAQQPNDYSVEQVRQMIGTGSNRNQHYGIYWGAYRDLLNLWQNWRGTGQAAEERDIAQLFQCLDRTLKGAMEVETWQDDLEAIGFVHQLLELNRAIAQVRPTVTANNVNDPEAWIETLLEAGEAREMAKGMSVFAQGLETIDLSQQALAFASRLVKAADGVDDATLQAQAQDAQFLSALINVGGAYAALNPIVASPDLNFLDAAWVNNLAIETSTSDLEGFLRRNQTMSIAALNLCQTLLDGFSQPSPSDPTQLDATVIDQLLEISETFAFNPDSLKRPTLPVGPFRVPIPTIQEIKEMVERSQRWSENNLSARSMTQREKDYAAGIFENSVNLDAVVIQRVPPNIVNDRAFVLGNRIS